jgi:serine/threonine-protein kinase
MPEPTLTADRNLLFGILALQMDFVSRDALIRAMHGWVVEKHKPLGQILWEQGALREAARAALELVVQQHLEQHGNDPHQSLAAVSSVGSVRQELEQVADADLHASLGHVSAARHEDAALGATSDYSAGTPTSSGLRFRVLRPHAKGGLGEVFVARDEELHREVALKKIQTPHADDPQSRSRFLLEAEVTGGLEHPGVVPVYGLGTYPDGRPFYAMRFVKGESLKDAIQHFHAADVPGRDPSERTLALRQLLGRFVAVCYAMAYAHSRGILHRDLKPANVMLGPFGETLVVDWGLAKVVGHLAGGDEQVEGTLRPPSADGSAPTQMGSAVGTPAFMSPEQAAGQVDLLAPASDVYSLGTMLYCLLTGKAPFEGREVGEALGWLHSAGCRFSVRHGPGGVGNPDSWLRLSAPLPPARHADGRGRAEGDVRRLVGTQRDRKGLLDGTALLHPARLERPGVAPARSHRRRHEVAIRPCLGGGVTVEPQRGACGEADVEAARVVGRRWRGCG